MVYSSPLSTFKNSIKSRPPLVVVTLCLVVFVLTTFSFAYYVQHRDEIEDLEIKDNWVSLLKYLNNAEICLDKGPLLGKDVPEEANVSTLATLSLKAPIEFNNLQGGIPLDGWSVSCPDRYSLPKGLKVSFVLGEVENQTNFDVCVVLSGPADFMPQFESQPSCVAKPASGPLKYGRLTMEFGHNEQQCDKGVSGTLHYDLRRVRDSKLVQYLSGNDKSVINMHLIVTSYFLLAVIIFVLCYAVLKGHFREEMRYTTPSKIFHT